MVSKHFITKNYKAELKKWIGWAKMPQNALVTSPNHILNCATYSLVFTKNTTSSYQVKFLTSFHYCCCPASLCHIVHIADDALIGTEAGHIDAGDVESVVEENRRLNILNILNISSIEDPLEVEFCLRVLWVCGETVERQLFTKQYSFRFWLNFKI